MLVKFLDDALLVAEVSHLLDVAAEALEAKRRDFGENVIDPFAAMFEMAGFTLDNLELMDFLCEKGAEHAEEIVKLEHFEND
ncbi:MAG: hypothetical protein NWR03_06360 [Akkermansiaceae bacterium]|jgi:hypothetical protein|nr:hypothetical protein [Akkermansiaceae bacterium]MDP4720685.1 hypothetical protein [Akkermansiaceae bacterium]MDP4897380.1 hypothetical protein [Akkermansiaceae bacterium]